MATETRARADVRRRVLQQAQRNTFRAFELYAQGVGRRGRMNRVEVEGMRRMLEFQLSRPMFRPDPSTRLEHVRADFTDATGRHVRGEWVEREVSTRGECVLLYVHGGAFVSGSPRSHRGLTSELAHRLQRSVFSVDYRLAPEHPFPAGPDDVLRAYAWLLASGVPAARIVVAGDSAGGHLSLGLTPRALRAGLPAPAGVVAFSPVVDPTMRVSEQRERELGRRLPVIDARTGRAAMNCFYRGDAEHSPEVQLLLDDLSVMPPVLIQSSADEILAGDAEAYIAALHAAGGAGDLRLWPRQTHVFHMGFRVSRSAREALDDVETFVAKVAPSPAAAG
ncbi:MAG: alpha/beta hydrolase [Jatrophihabitans sp.]|uniref:alpha/beta hydrolase n=1 Tax=Jatrophihabitans sp. TaxID=1932789 RepID=UPI003F7FDD3C